MNSLYQMYQNNELLFSLAWIALYIASLSAADGISEGLGMAKSVTAPLCILLSLLLWGWIRKNGLAEKYGLCPFRGDMGRYLYFIPLAVIASVNLWNGFTFRFSAAETVLYVASMLCAGFLEEVIFRGLLFQALCRENVNQAILISSVTFGLGHIVNLLNGAEVSSTLLQVCYACAIGFLFTVIFYKGKSLVPCIATHSAVNSLSAFAVEGTMRCDLLTAAALTAVSAGYALVILKADRGRGTSGG